MLYKFSVKNNPLFAFLYSDNKVNARPRATIKQSNINYTSYFLVARRRAIVAPLRRRLSTDNRVAT